MDSDAPKGYARAVRRLRVLAPLVPRRQRDEWRAEWQAEMWQQLQQEPEQSRALRGAIPHALWLRIADLRLQMLFQDLRYAWRGLRRRPSFAIPVALLLAAGIAVTTTMFTVVNSVLIEQVPYPHAERLVAIYSKSPAQQRPSFSAPDLLDYRAATGALSDIAGVSSAGANVLTGAPGPASVSVTEVTANYFATLGVTFFLGRPFLLDEEGNPAVVVLSYRLWHTRYGGDASIIGRTIIADGTPAQVVGVLPPVMDRMTGADMFRPFDFHSPHSSVREYHNTVQVIGRLRAGASIAQATAELNVVAARLAATYVEDHGLGVAIGSYRDALTAYAVSRLLMLSGAAALLLLIVCGSVASMLLARAAARGREVAIRAAIGASRVDVIRFALSESVILAVIGGAIGLVVTQALVRLIVTLRPAMLPRAKEVEVDGRVLLFVVAVALVTALLCGVMPAWRVSRRVGTPGGAIQERLVDRRRRDVIVTLQLALTLVLLAAGAMLMRSLVRMEQVDPGFKPAGVITAQLAPPGIRYSRDRRVSFINDMLQRIRSTPGVTAAAIASKLVMTSNGGNAPVWNPVHPPATSDEKMKGSAEINVVSGDYYRTMQIRVIEGAVPSGRSPDAVISASLAARLYPGRSAIGAQLTFETGSPTSATIVAVVGDVHTASLDTRPAETLYLNADQNPEFLTSFTIIARTNGDPARLEQPLHTVVAALDPDLPLTHVQLLRDVVGNTKLQRRWTTALLAGFSLLALALAVAGVFGTMAYSVTLRIREFGIRAALGANRRHIAMLVIQRGTIVISAGVLLGIGGSFAAGGIVRAWLFEVRPADPASLIGATLLLVLAGAVACGVPARRAMNINPQVALRGD